MAKNPFLKPCQKCGGSGKTGWFKKETCIPCGGTGYGEPDNLYWLNFKVNVLERATSETSVANLHHLESGIAVIKALLKAVPGKEGTYSQLLGNLYQSKGFILADIGSTQKNQRVLWLEAIDYLRIAEKWGPEYNSDITGILRDFRRKCSPDEQREVENLYRAKHPNKEIPF